MTFPVKRLQKLLPMLLSQYEGEAINAARLIDKTLAGAGYNIHDLVKALDTRVQIQYVEKITYVERIVYREREAA